MPRNRKGILLCLALILPFYFLISLWRFSFTPFGSHPDGVWYHGVARNLAQGRGLVERVVCFFYPPPESVTHPVSTFWNPVSYFILGINYRLFGISDFTARLPGLLFDALLTLIIFWFCLKCYDHVEIAIFSSLIFATHGYLMTIRLMGGAAETFHAFFVALFCLTLGQAFKKEKFFYLSAVCAGLAYLTRNESLWTFLVILLVFLCQRTFPQENSSKPAWKIMVISTIIFLAVVLPWEIRNRLVYGGSAYLTKCSLLFTQNYYDTWSASLEPEGLIWFVKYHFGMGLRKFLINKLQSYYYKLDVTAQILSWPILLLFLLGIVRNIRLKEYWPAMLYFVVTYFLMGFLNSSSQGGGWHAPGALLAFIVPMSVSGSYLFGELITGNNKKAKAIGFALSSFLFLYQLGDNYKQYRLWQKIDFKSGTQTYALEVSRYLETILKDQERSLRSPRVSRQDESLKEKIVLMTHNPQYLNFYTDIPGVQIPAHDSIEDIKKIIRKYQCNYLVLYGTIPSVFAKLYSGAEEIPGFKLVYEKVVQGIGLEGAGDRVKIYKIEL